MLTGSAFDLFDGNCDGQNGLHTHFARQRTVCYVDMTVTLGVNRLMILFVCVKPG